MCTMTLELKNTVEYQQPVLKGRPLRVKPAFRNRTLSLTEYRHGFQHSLKKLSI
jgi:hypothetical protein